MIISNTAVYFIPGCIYMVVRPIPKAVLIHQCTYEEFVQGDGFETEDGFKPPVTLSNVLIQPSNTSNPNITRNANGEILVFNSVLFFDVVNSSSNGPFEFKEKSKVTFNGKDMIVEKVNPIYAFTLHHWEVYLT